MCNLNRFSILSTLFGALLALPLTSCMTIDAMYGIDPAKGPGSGSFTAVKTEPVNAVCDVYPHAREERVYRGHGAETAYFLTHKKMHHQAESYEFMCVADGYQKSTVTVKPGLSRDLWWNVLWLKGMPFAVAWDLALGVAWQYPKSVTIELEPTEAVTD